MLAIPQEAIDRLDVAAQASSRPRAVGAQAPHILVVDDDEDLRWLLDLEFRLSDFSVTLANNGREALRQIRRERPDVVLLDLMMPGLGGIGFLACVGRVAADPPPIVIYSAFVNPYPPLKNYPHVGAVLQKPSQFDQIVETVNRVIGLQSS
jgi:CheY-like chemotaxis protein